MCFRCLVCVVCMLVVSTVYENKLHWCCCVLTVRRVAVGRKAGTIFSPIRAQRFSKAPICLSLNLSLRSSSKCASGVCPTRGRTPLVQAGRHGSKAASARLVIRQPFLASSLYRSVAPPNIFSRPAHPGGEHRRQGARPSVCDKGRDMRLGG